ncbi:hypothetical protein [Lacibacter sediminis]|uniref:Cell wall anchor protein n=1 Tax=Lacibacter sediminis TaxID=2760713 RepID=A0A7G5XHB0_9BACT|nr:hypothetical protein [Lacibacter sediminis]QNA44863.1 hypothetical protein H4075_01295 [Lacibacter sediminis]
MKNLFVLIVCACTVSVSAQIGIGTTSPTSTLDVRGSLSLNYRAFSSSTTASSTDNTLLFTGNSAATVTLPDATGCAGRVYSIKNASTTSPVPVLTVATTSSQTIDGSSALLLSSNKSIVTVVSDGANWNIMSSGIVKARNNFVLVQSTADLPAPVAGIITLVSGTTYEINGTIVLTSKINLNGCYLIGKDANNDKLIYSPSSGELFTGTKGGTIKTLTLVASTTGSKLFNLDLGSTESLLVRDNIIASCKDVGLVKGGNIIFFSVVSYVGNTTGITYENNNNLLLDNMAWFSTNAGTFEKLVGSFGVIEKLGGFSHSMSSLSATGIDVSGITSISDAGNLKNTAFLGTGTKVNGSFSSKWEVEAPGLTTEKDDVATGNLYLTSANATSFSGVNTPTKVLGTTTAVGLFRVSSATNNRLVYDGSKTRRFSVTGSVSVTSSSANKYFSFYIYKNGVKLPESEQAMRLSTGVDKGSLTITCTVQLSTNDYIEIWAENTSDGSSMTVETLNLTIK